MTEPHAHSRQESTFPRKTIVHDLLWLAAIAGVMATSGIWSWLSPRPEIGQVAVLWLPNAILTVALLRNWKRRGFCFLMLTVFVGVGLVQAFEDKSIPGTLALLLIDILEAGLIALGLVIWSGTAFRLSTALHVSVFGALSAGACLIGACLAAVVSQIPLGETVVAAKAPVQVGFAWFMADLATYLLVASPILAITGRGGQYIWSGMRQSPGISLMGAVAVMILTFVGFALPQWLATHTGLALGSGGLILIAFPLATFLSFKWGPAIASLIGAAIGVPAIYATMAGIGPFGRGEAAANVFDMQATLIVCVFTLLLVGSMASELRARSNALERALDEAIKAKQGRS
jgi:hypothetical protein